MNYYCNQCAKARGLLNPLSSDLNFTGSTYQLGKFLKHTVPNSGSFISTFNDEDYTNYENYIVNASVSGSVEVQSNGKVNYIYYAGSDTGILSNNGQYIAPNNAVKVVLTSDDGRIHAYPTGSLGILQTTCEDCGGSIIR